MSAEVQVSVLRAPLTDALIAQLAAVLVDCVAGGASVSFMTPFTQDDGLQFFRKVANSVACGDTVLLAQLGLDTPPNQPHRADVKKCWCIARRAGKG